MAAKIPNGMEANQDEFNRSLVKVNRSFCLGLLLQQNRKKHEYDRCARDR